MTDGPVLGSPEIPESAPSSVPLTLAQRAQVAQEHWAPAYAQEHRVRRFVSWLVAIVLAAYVSGCAFRLLAGTDLFERFEGSGCAGYGPLLVVMYTARWRRHGERTSPFWLGAWALLACDAVGSWQPLASGDYFLGVPYVLSVLLIGVALAWGLRIPDDPSIDWNLVFLEHFLIVRSARGGHSYLPIIDSPRKAEENAAAWLRRLGYPDALVTPVGPDDGMDVSSSGAVAQVKWKTRPVSAPDVRDLAGTGKPGQARFFFSRSGYTKPALRWAADPEHRVQLFTMGDDGNILACNYRAKRSLWNAPRHIPVASRRPPSRWLPWINVTCRTFTLLDAIFLAYVTMLSFAHGQVLMGVLLGAMALILGSLCVPAIFLPTARVTRNVIGGGPMEIRESFSRPRLPEVDKGLPSDAFVGFEPDRIRALLDWGVDAWVYGSAIRRVVHSRRRSQPGTSGH